jgi:alginate O-acetyltransferase complex protein AlgI
MTYNSQIFILLFAPAVIAFYWLVPQRWRLGALLLANYLFYALFDWRFCLLLAGITCAGHYSGLRIASAATPRQVRVWTVLAVVLHLGLLASFKYLGFITRSVNALSATLHGSSLVPAVQLLLPAGISFYTFQALSYLLDLRYKRCERAPSLLHYAVFLSLFPTIIAGPILRWRQLGPQLAALPQRLDWERLGLGLTLISAGLIKKVLVADQLALLLDPLWADYRHLLPPEAWMAVLAYSVQLYFDFAGLSLIAIGLGLLLGLELPQNFNSPYRASDIADFWRRWHMTLSFWLRDYLFPQLGGLTLRGRWFAVVLTMVLAGLWHGAAWTFVAWGTYHGLLLFIHHALKTGLKLRWRGRAWGVAGTLLLVVLGWVLFRAPSLPAALAVYGKLFALHGWGERVVFTPQFMALTLGALAWAVFAPNAYHQLLIRRAQPLWYVQLLLGIMAAAAIVISSTSAPFLYSQF